MEKIIIKVPGQYRYMGEWNEFIDLFPRFPHIMDKQVPGCGFTEWCLTNPDNVILCSPRNMLIQNKTEQHPDDVFRVYNDKYDIDLEVDKDISDSRKDDTKDEDGGKLQKMSYEEQLGFTEKLTMDLSEYFLKRSMQNRPYKILVTYDSFRILKDVLIQLNKLDKFQIIVDEFQTIFTDSRFKSNTELEFVEVLKGISRVCYLSATPMINSYLEMLPEFKDLPYFELDWVTENPTRVKKPKLKLGVVDSIYQPIKKIIESYKSGVFENKIIKRENGSLEKIESKEAAIYVNSVNNIIQIIKKNKLKPEECNILCSRTPENLKKIQKQLGKQWIIGKVPLKHESNKMFTFCTRTVYLGADFYSDNARSFILSDANIDCLAVDISLDLPQILGRQRSLTNPWKDSAEFYFKPFMGTKDNKLSPDDFEKKILDKIKATENLLKAYEDAKTIETKGELTKAYEIIAEKGHYKDYYIAVNKHAGANKIPVLNNLVMIAEKRAYDIQQIDYADRFSVISILKEAFSGDKEVQGKVMEILEEYWKIDGIKAKLRFINELEEGDEVLKLVIDQISDGRIEEYLKLGKDRLKALSYNVTEIKKELEVTTYNPLAIREIINKEFKVGEKIFKSDVKERLRKVYSSINFKKSPKAIDILNWFEVKDVNLSDEDGKRIKGYELVREK